LKFLSLLFPLEKKRFEKKVNNLKTLCEKYLRKENVFGQTPPSDELISLAQLLIRLAVKKEKEFVKSIRQAPPFKEEEVRELIEDDLLKLEKKVQAWREALKSLEGSGSEMSQV